MDKQLDILVVEDKEEHQESARVLLAGHNVEIVGTFDEAADRICGTSRYAHKKSSEKKSYAVVLTDMFLPQGRGDCLADKSQGKIEMPFGYCIALMACKEATPYVAIFSWGDHHKNGIAYGMEEFLDGTVQQVGNSRLAILGAGNYNIINFTYKTPDGRIGTLEEVGIKKTDRIMKREYFTEPKGSKFVKNWKAALDYVVSGKKKQEE